MASIINPKSINLLFESVDVLAPQTWKWYFLDERGKKVGREFGLVTKEDCVRIIGGFHSENRKMFLDLLESDKITIYYSAAPNEKKLIKRYLTNERCRFQDFRTLVFSDWIISYNKKEFREVRIFPKEDLTIWRH